MNTDTGVDYHTQVPLPGDELPPELLAPDSMVRPKMPRDGQDQVQQLLLPIEDVLHRLRVEAEWLRRTMYSTLAHMGRGGVGARRYSRNKLAAEVERVYGMFALVSDLVRDRVPGGEIPEVVRKEVTSKIAEARQVAHGNNPDGTERTR